MRPQRAGDSADLVVVGPDGAGLAPFSGDGEEGHERRAPCCASAEQHLPVGRVDAVAVLNAHHRRDRRGLVQVLQTGAGDAKVADQSSSAQLGEGPEMLADGLLAHDAQIHHVEMVAAELTQVLLDLAA